MTSLLDHSWLCSSFTIWTDVLLKAMPGFVAGDGNGHAFARSATMSFQCPYPVILSVDHAVDTKAGPGYRWFVEPTDRHDSDARSAGLNLFCLALTGHKLGIIDWSGYATA